MPPSGDAANFFVVFVNRQLPVIKYLTRVVQCFYQVDSVISGSKENSLQVFGSRYNRPTVLHIPSRRSNCQHVDIAGRDG